eukprot:9479261-Pyramimonas_sp.AAC.1
MASGSPNGLAWPRANCGRDRAGKSSPDFVPPPSARVRSQSRSKGAKSDEVDSSPAPHDEV